jgi:threonine/homoserine/homoserine lactone efflux protein
MEYYLSIITFTFVSGITPGPNNMMLMASGLNHGIRKSLPHYFGICFGFPLMVVLIGFGMGTILSRYPSIYFYIKILGILYLLYLSWKIANAGNPNAIGSIKQPLSFMQAAIFQWLNPKAWVISIGALAAFTNQENFYTSVLSVVVVYFFMSFVCMGFWLKLGESLQHILSEGRRIHYFNIAMAVLLVLSILPMIYTDIFH